MKPFGTRFLLLFTILLFVGLAAVAFGQRFGMWGFSAIGGVWILLSTVAFRSTIPSGTRARMLIGLVLGASGGAVFAWLLGDSAAGVTGVVGGAVLGGIGCSFGVFGLLELVSGGAGILFELVIPQKVTTLLLLGLFVLGAVLGAFSLGGLVMRYFGGIGGGFLAGGAAGSIAGLLLGARPSGESSV